MNRSIYPAQNMTSDGGELRAPSLWWHEAGSVRARPAQNRAGSGSPAADGPSAPGVWDARSSGDAAGLITFDEERV